MPVLSPANTITRSATSFIQSALRLVGALRSGLNLSAAELTDSAQVLNDMLDAWSAKRTTVFVVPRVTLDQNQNTLMLIPSQQTYTLGNINANENFLLPRPPKLERVSIMYNASQSTPVELPMDMLDDVRWQGIANKSVTSILPQVCYLEPNFPDISLSFWPIPTQANPVVLYPWQALAQFADLTSQFQFPPGYARAIRFNLAVDLAAEFPCDMQKLPLVVQRASLYLTEIENLNVKPKEAVADEALVGSYGKMGNIFTGSSNRSLKY